MRPFFQTARRFRSNFLCNIGYADENSAVRVFAALSTSTRYAQLIFVGATTFGIRARESHRVS